MSHTQPPVLTPVYQAPANAGLAPVSTVDPVITVVQGVLPPIDGTAPSAPPIDPLTSVVSLSPLDDNAHPPAQPIITSLVPINDEEGIDDPGEIRAGIFGKRSFSQKSLKATDPDQIAANEAFKKLFQEVGALVRAGQLPRNLRCPSDTVIKYMTVFDGTKEIRITVADPETGELYKLESMTIGELKSAMIKYRRDHGDQQPTTSVERDIQNYFQAFDRVFKKTKISRISHYSATGADKRGGLLDKKPLEITHHTPAIIHKKQTKDLILAADHGLSESKDWKRNKSSGPLSFIQRIKVADDEDRTKEKQKKAIDRILHAESFCVQFRERLTKKIDELKEEMQSTDDYHEKQALRNRRNQYTELRDQLQNDLNRHALYVAVSFADELRLQPQLCYDAILEDFYEEIYANADEENKPSFQDFIQSPEAKPFILYAKEAASTVITHPGQYRRYCATEGIEPKKDHINSFVLQAIAATPYNRSDEDLFRMLPIEFDAGDGDRDHGDQGEIKEMIEDTRRNVDRIFLGRDFDLNEDVQARVRSLDNDSKTPEQYLKAVLSDQKYRPLFVDEKTKDLHGTATKVKRWFTDKPHFWNKNVPENATAAASLVTTGRVDTDTEDREDSESA